MKGDTMHTVTASLVLEHDRVSSLDGQHAVPPVAASWGSS
nr:hypothetical protein [Kibdelosporangium sp. MJ126-NF4]CTQ89070.1 hypothetical protein [Kibdelosporangium sp. MJ126-NF4]